VVEEIATKAQSADWQFLEPEPPLAAKHIPSVKRSANAWIIPN